MFSLFMTYKSLLFPFYLSHQMASAEDSTGRRKAGQALSKDAKQVLYLTHPRSTAYDARVKAATLPTGQINFSKATAIKHAFEHGQ